MTIVNILGPTLVFLAFWVFARGIIRKSSGKEFKPLLAFLLLIAAFSFRYIFGDGTFFQRLAMSSLDFGIGMILASFYLAKHQGRSKIFWVPGALALILSGMIHFSMGLSGVISDWMRSKPSNVEILVELGEDDHLSEIKPILRRYKAKAEKTFKNVDVSDDADVGQYYTIYVDSAYVTPLLQDLQMDRENVDDVSRNTPVELFKPQPTRRPDSKGIFEANDPDLGKQWYLDKLKYNTSFKIVKNHDPQKKIKLAIVDTGVDSKHEDLKGVFKSSPGNSDNHSHGTHCAGIAGSHTNNGTGIGSLNWEGKFLDVMGFHALDGFGRGTDKTVAQAVVDAANAGADVISMSLGGYHPVPPDVQVEAIEYARKKGAIVVVAAGNSNDNAKKYSPANIPGVITVGAVDQQLNKAVFSNTNTDLKMPIAAPGVDIHSTVPGSKYQAFSGTSMATPLVAGVIGVMKAYKPDLTAEEAHKILRDTGIDARDTRKVGKVVDPNKALQAVMK